MHNGAQAGLRWCRYSSHPISPRSPHAWWHRRLFSREISIQPLHRYLPASRNLPYSNLNNRRPSSIYSTVGLKWCLLKMELLVAIRRCDLTSSQRHCSASFSIHPAVFSHHLATSRHWSPMNMTPGAIGETCTPAAANGASWRRWRPRRHHSWDEGCGEHLWRSAACECDMLVYRHTALKPVNIVTKC